VSPPRVVLDEGLVVAEQHAHGPKVVA
jgi:hypothetical protein